MLPHRRAAQSAHPADEQITGQVGVWYKKAETLMILWGDTMYHLTPVFSFTFYTIACVLVAPTNPVLK